MEANGLRIPCETEMYLVTIAPPLKGSKIQRDGYESAFIITNKEWGIVETQTTALYLAMQYCLQAEANVKTFKSMLSGEEELLLPWAPSSESPTLN